MDRVGRRAELIGRPAPSVVHMELPGQGSAVRCSLSPVQARWPTGPPQPDDGWLAMRLRAPFDGSLLYGRGPAKKNLRGPLTPAPSSPPWPEGGRRATGAAPAQVVATGVRSEGAAAGNVKERRVKGYRAEANRRGGRSGRARGHGANGELNSKRRSHVGRCSEPVTSPGRGGEGS